MAISHKEQLIRAYKKANKPPPKRPAASLEARAERQALRAEQIFKLVRTQTPEGLAKLVTHNIIPEYNQAGTAYKNVAPVLSAGGIMYNAITKDRKVICRHTQQVDAFIASVFNARTTKTYQADGTRQPHQSAQGQALSAKFQGLSIKVACGILRQAYQEAIAANPADWQGLHKQLDWEIDLLRGEQDRIAKLPR